MTVDPAQFYSRTRNARKVIVVDLGFLGDTVHLVPALWELKRSHPAAELHVLTTPLGCEVLRMVPCVTRAWGMELLPEKRTWSQQWQVLRALRRERFDAAFNFSGADRTVFMTALTGARWRLGHRCARKHFWSEWLIPTWVPRRPQTVPVFEQRLQVLAACGLEPGPARFELEVPAEARDWAQAAVPQGSIHLSLNASTHLKEWPLRHWVQLGQALSQAHGCELVATGSNYPRETERLEKFASQAGPGLKVFSGLPVPRLAALLQRCAIHVGTDSGVLHLAMALNVPTVSLFRQYPALLEWAPRGPRHRLLSVPCACVDQKHPPCEYKPEAECLAGLSPAEVLQAVLENLASNRSTPGTISKK